MSRQSMLEKLGLTIADTQPKNNNEKERIEILEDAFAELCEVVFAEVDSND